MNSVEPGIIPVPRISTASTDNKLRPEIQGFLLQLVIINEPSLLDDLVRKNLEVNRCSCWWNCHWCQHGIAVAPRDVIDATKSHLAVPWTPYRVGWCLEAPFTQLTRSLYPQDWILMLVEDIEDLGDGPEDRTEVGEALDELEKH